MMVVVKSNFVSGLFPSVYADVSVSWGFMATEEYPNGIPEV
jgi:hypothetical protein